MGEVIHINSRKRENKRESFKISAEVDDHNAWQISVDWNDKTIQQHQAFRTIADALVGIIGGLIEAAEGVDPSSRGQLIANFGLYEDGLINIHCPLDMNDDMRRFIIVALEKAKIKIRKMATLKAGTLE